MKLIGENIHVISKSVREALIKRDKDFVISMIEKQKNMNAIDLNVGPAKGELVGILPWLTELVNSNGAKTISFDTSNAEEMRKGLEVCRNPEKAFINSATDNIERLENIVTEDTKTLFNSKDCFIWLTLFNKFTKTRLDDSKFGEFLVAFVGGLRNKFVKGKLFDKVDEVGSTKDKRVIEDKLHILESLMKEYLHIEDAKPLSDVEFISQNVDIPIADVIEDIQLYMDTLDELEEDHIRVGSKLLHNENRQSMLAIVAYAYKNDIDLEEWMEEYDSNNNTYFVDQKKNYLHMVEDVTAYNKRKAVA